jgi:cytochrome c-type biogenesis protein CcmH
MTRIIISTLLCLGLLAQPAWAAIEAYKFKDAATEAEYKALIAELRCLVCQNQNLAGSDADLAKDLRQQTYEMLQAGKNREQVVEYMVNRYGDFVLYRPPVKSSTLLLWAGPFALLVIVLIIVVIRVKKADPVDAPQQQNLKQAHDLLSEDSDKA